MARHKSYRSKPKKRPNRYNPNSPDYKAVHASGMAHQLARLVTLQPLFHLIAPSGKRRS